MTDETNGLLWAMEIGNGVVFSADGQTLGHITDVILDHNDSCIACALVFCDAATPGFQTAPRDDARIEDTTGRLVLIAP